MDNYLLQFLAIASAHALAVLSPGQDLLLVFQHSLVHKRPKVYYSCIGIGCGITIHTILALSGLGLLLNRYPLANQIFVLAGAGFLLYLAYGAYRSGKFQFSSADAGESAMSRLRLWQLGFLTNALNAKAVFFFLSLFSVVITPSTPVWLQGFYVIYLSLATALLFMALSWLFTHAAVVAKLEHYSMALQRGVAAMFVVLAALLLISLT